MIDLDYNATTPVKDSVKEAMEPYLNGKYGNPSSIHRVGQAAKAAVEEARENLAGALGADREYLLVTGSGSEANTTALRSFLDRPYEDRRILSTPVEHSSIKDTLSWLEDRGATVDRAPMLANGQPDLSWFRDQIDASVDLVSVMMVNNETGIRFPVEEIGSLAQEYDVPVHTDAVQAFGKVAINYDQLPVDLMSVSSHKIGGPKGVGVLVAPKKFDLDPLIFGGHQERDRRGGTENVSGLVGFGKAAEAVRPEAFTDLADLRDEFEAKLTDRVDAVRIVGSGTDRVGNTSGILVKGVDGEDVVMRLDLEGIAAATGSACTSGSPQPSHVIEAIPLPGDFETSSFVRISLPPDFERDTMDNVLKKLSHVVEDLRSGNF
ncbi:MAG: cysteine desulfurase family protein, partial [bacterium]